MTLTIHLRSDSLTLELPETQREVSVRGFRIGVDMISVVRLDQADTTQGRPACQCVSNPMEAR